jgi:hypothetical protein
MKNTAVNTLNYTGIVTLSQYVGNKKLKLAQAYNTGGESLFEFIAGCFAGNFDNNKRPTKIKLVRRTQEDDEYKYTSISGFIFVRNVSIESAAGECRVRYSFMIPRDLVEDLTNFSTIGLGLYANDTSEQTPDRFAAYCTLATELDLSNKLLANASLVVDWELIIYNNPGNSNLKSALK